MKKKVLLSAFACQPDKGSEEGGGWNWATGLAKHDYEVHCLTWDLNKDAIESKHIPSNLHFHYVTMPKFTKTLYHYPGPAIYGVYLLWQTLAYRKAKSLHKDLKFDIAHHVTWGNIQIGSFLYKLNIPFVFGPTGGGQKAPEAFKEYFTDHWSVELNRERAARILLKYNPGSKTMLKQADTVLVANPDTFKVAADAGSKNCHISYDAALPESFFPDKDEAKRPSPNQLNLIWVGRFESRKGLLLVLDVMQHLKSHPQIKLTVVGYGEREKEIKKYVKAHGLEDTVTLTGKMPFERVRQYYAENDVFFFTSLRDSGPAQLVEAMAFGLPVVTINLHGQSVLVDDDRGIRCSVESPERTVAELKEALIDLYHHPEKVTKMSIEASKFARKQSWPLKIAQIVNDYYPS